MTGEEGGELRVEQLAELSVLALAKELPVVLVVESTNGSEFKLKEMPLAGVHVDSVDAFGLLSRRSSNGV